MLVDPQIKIWLFGSLITLIGYLIKDVWKSSRSESRQNTKDIGKMQIKQAEQQRDLDAAFEKIRQMEQLLLRGVQRKPGN